MSSKAERLPEDIYDDFGRAVFSEHTNRNVERLQ
jgi:hypothetical protein